MAEISFEDLAARLTDEAKALLVEMADAHLAAGSGDRMFLESGSLGGGRFLIMSTRGYRANLTDVDGGALNDLARYGLLQTEHGGRNTGYRVGSDGLAFHRYLRERPDSSTGKQNVRVTLDPAENAQLEVIIEVIHRAAESGELDALDRESRAELEAELATLAAQQRSPKPKRGIVRESLASVRSILESVTASAAWQGVITLLDRI